MKAFLNNFMANFIIQPSIPPFQLLLLLLRQSLTIIRVSIYPTLHLLLLLVQLSASLSIHRLITGAVLECESNETTAGFCLYYRPI